MINIKPDVVTALENDQTLVGLLGGPRIYLLNAPDAKEFPRITYYEANNAEYPYADELEAITEVLLVVDIWNKTSSDGTNDGSTSAIAQAVDNVMATQGFYREFSTDLYEDDTLVYHKSMRYRKLRLFDGDPGSLPVDPWLEALAEWTESKLGAGWTVYRNIFPSGYTRPAVIWILTGINVQPKSRAVFDVDKSFLGIVLGGAPNQQVGAAVSLVEGLYSDIKIPLDIVNRRYLTAGSLTSDIRPDAITVAHVRVDLSRVTARPTEDVPYIMQIESSGNLS